MNAFGPATHEVRPLDPTMAPAWDAFVEDCPEATFFHRAGWKTVIEASFGHRCHYLYALREGVIQGVLPLTLVAGRLFGRALIANAFCVYGGPAARDDTAEAALTRAALDLARSLGVDYLEYRSRARRHPDWPCNDELYVTFRKPMVADPEKNMRTIPRKQRAMVRKGIKNDLVAEIDADIARFFPIYAASVRDLGTPVFSRRYFAKLKEVFGEACEIVVVSHQGRPVSAVLSFYFREEVLPYYGGGLTAARDLAAYDFMYWDVMRRSCQAGYRLFDFGRSKRGTGSFSFKKHWGFEPETLSYEYQLLRGGAIPAKNPLNPKYRLFINAWRRLPLPVANGLGPWISRQLG